jgi:hypothetical protein
MVGGIEGRLLHCLLFSHVLFFGRVIENADLRRNCVVDGFPTLARSKPT